MRNEEGFKKIIGYPHDSVKEMKGISLPKEQFRALADSLGLHPCNKEAHFGWSDKYGEVGHYLYQHDDSYALLLIRIEYT